MLKAAFSPYELVFKEVAVTSRESMLTKRTYFVRLWDESAPEVYGIGECGLFRGLSCDDRPDYENVLSNACRNINELSASGLDSLCEYPSIVFGLETAQLDLQNSGRRQIFDSAWSRGEDAISINGLVWMGDKSTMLRRVEEKLSSGFRCLKFKIGGIDFNDELEMIRSVRSRFSVNELEIRLDVNGGFSPAEALSKLECLSRYEIHSIEQPIKPRQWKEMAEICRNSPIPIALDEELIGINRSADMEKMIDAIRPAYIILKPSLCGGFSGSNRWINVANACSVGWWATSALESNVGLNAIAQWVSTKDISMPQGLGTGLLYTNNVTSPIVQTDQNLRYDLSRKWEMPEFKWTC